MAIWLVLTYFDLVSIIFFQTFPEQIWLPPSAAQRGTLLRTFGDPQTPVYPSKNYAFREFSEDELRKNGILPRIPVMPIGYKEAEKIMEALDGPEALASLNPFFSS